MSFLLRWSRRSSAPVTSNAGHAEILVTLALGAGHVVVEEIDAHAEIEVTLAQGAGHLESVPVPQPRPNYAVAPPSHLFKRIAGRGRATMSVPTAHGTGTLFLRRTLGVGAAALRVVQAQGRGRLVFPELFGAGAADIDAPSASGLGVLFLPQPAEIVVAPIAVRAATCWDDDDAQVLVASRRRRKVATPAFDDDDEVLLLLMELK